MPLLVGAGQRVVPVHQVASATKVVSTAGLLQEDHRHPVEAQEEGTVAVHQALLGTKVAPTAGLLLRGLEGLVDFLQGGVATKVVSILRVQVEVRAQVPEGLLAIEGPAPK